MRSLKNFRQKSDMISLAILGRDKRVEVKTLVRTLG